MNACSRFSLGLVLALAACAVDDRELRSAGSGGSGSSGGSAGQSSAGRPSSGAGAESGAGGEAPNGLVDGCADLDTDGIADCTTTLVQSPSFTTGVTGWEPVDGAELTWDAKNALGDLPSGSAKLRAATPRASAAQCVAISGEKLVIAYAQAFPEPNTDSDDVARAQVHVAFYPSPDCADEPLGFFETPPSTEAGVWSTVQAGSLSSDQARSLSISLVGVKADGAAELSVYFDNVMLKTKDVD